MPTPHTHTPTRTPATATALHWLAALAVTVLVGALAATEGDAPTDADLAAAVAADLADAQQQARAEFAQSLASAAQALPTAQGQRP